MSAYKPDSQYLFEEPWQFGLRGDPHLWQEMKMAYENSQVSSLEEFRSLVHSVFFKATQNQAVKGQDYFVESYSHGGMSSGMVCSDFWLEKGFPLLEQRFIEALK